MIFIVLPLYGPTPTPAQESNEQKAKAANHQNETTSNSKATHTFAPNVPQAEPPNTQKKTAKNTNKNNGETAVERWLLYTNFALVFVIFLQFIVFIVQTKWMRKSTQTARQHMIVSQRAFVFIKEFKYLHNRTGIAIFPQWENSGNTQTKNMISRVNWDYFPRNIPDDFNFTDTGKKEQSHILIGPKSSILASRLNIKQRCINDVIKGDGHVYVWGWADYNDVFENTRRHRTEFCYRVDFPPPVNNQFIAYFIVHTKYNGTDDECMKEPTQ